MSKADDCTIPIRSPLESNIVKFPVSVSRKALTREPRRSNDGAAEEPAVKASRTEGPAALMPIDMPLGGDTVYQRIAIHREAVSVYDRCVDAENEAEGKVSDEDFAALEQATNQAFEEMMLAAHCLIIDLPTTITGLIRWTRYVRQLVCDSDSPYLPDEINGKPWIDPFLRVLTLRLRNMGEKLPHEKAEHEATAPTNVDALAQREFNEACGSASGNSRVRNLSKEEIKPALSLKVYASSSSSSRSTA
jgi:hypothetical protein